MAPGKTPRVSPVIKAINRVEKLAATEIRVQISKGWIERDPHRRAQQIFRHYGMQRTTHRNAVLFYLNLRRRRFAIIADCGIETLVEPRYWQELAQKLREDLLSTHYENAIALAILTVGVTLQTHFPADQTETGNR